MTASGTNHRHHPQATRQLKREACCCCSGHRATSGKTQGLTEDLVHGASEQVAWQISTLRGRNHSEKSEFWGARASYVAESPVSDFIDTETE